MILGKAVYYDTLTWHSSCQGRATTAIIVDIDMATDIIYKYEHIQNDTV